MRCLFLAWQAHRRTTGLCAACNVPLRVIGGGQRGLATWLAQTVETLRVLHRERPEILFVPNPSLGLTVLAYLTRPLFAFYLVVDAHNEGVRPFVRSGAFVRWLTRRLLRGADATIVSNAALAMDVTEAGGRPLVLPDSLPIPPALPPIGGEKPQVVVIATFAHDEPIAAVVAAAAKLPEVSFAVSGDAARFAKLGIELPSNVRLTDFLPDDEYWRLLAAARVVCDLTLKPDCIVCGAYEGLALAKPMVLSDNQATREIFGPAAILTGSGADDIHAAVRTALAQRERLEANAHAVRDEFRARWPALAAAAWSTICAGAATSRPTRS